MAITLLYYVFTSVGRCWHNFWRCS